MKYLEGYSQALQAVSSMTRAEHIEYIQGMYGSSRLKFEATDEEIKREAIRQCKLDFLDPIAETYEQDRQRLENW